MMFKDYFKNIYSCLANLEITDRQGNNLDINDGFEQLIDVFLRLKFKNGTSIIVGNGGSAAIAMHFENDLIASCKIKAVTFYSQPLLTAYSNDHGYKNAFCYPFELWKDKKNLLIAISSSGESDNIINIVHYASINKIKVITLSGFKYNNKLRSMGDLNFYINSNSYGIVEVSHQCILHFITDTIKEKLKYE